MAHVKIKYTSGVVMQLMGLFITMLLVIILLPVIFFETTAPVLPSLALVFFIFGIWFFKEKIMSKAGAFRAHVYQDNITNAKRVALEGYRLKVEVLGIEDLFSDVDLEASTIADFTQNVPTADGMVTFTGVMIAKPDFTHGNPSKNIVHYVSIEPEARKNMLRSFAQSTVRMKFSGKKMNEVTSIPSDQILSLAEANAEANKIGMYMVSVLVSDVDPNEAALKALEMRIFGEKVAAVHAELELAGFSKERASEAALIIAERGVTKQIMQFQGIPDNLFGPLTTALAAFGKTVSSTTKKTKK